MGRKRSAMIGTKSCSICVKFRMDDPDQQAAYSYLQKDRGTKTYGEFIADLIKEKNREQSDGLLTEIRHICQEIRDCMDGFAISPVGSDRTPDDRAEKETHKGEITEGVADLMRLLSGEDEH